MKNLTFLLDIGSSKISLIACRNKGDKSSILTSITSEYDGFMDGEFFSADQLDDVISKMLNEMSDCLHCSIGNMCVGVPSEFMACVCKRVTRNFVPSKRITEPMLESLFDGVEGFGADEYDVASFSPIKYEIDGFTTTKLSNKRINQIVMDCSYILVKKSFVGLIKDILEKNGVKEIDFISTALAQARFARSQIMEELTPVVIVDIGHITTSVAVGLGEGLMMLSSFSLGGGHITADLMQVNGLTYSEADLIKRKVCLTVQGKKDEKYVVYKDGQPIKALINITNDVVKARIENIATVVEKVLSSSESFNQLPIYLTGDGVTNFRGVINVFEAVTNRKVNILKSSLNNGSDKYQTSKISLVNIIGELI